MSAVRVHPFVTGVGWWATAEATPVTWRPPGRVGGRLCPAKSPPAIDGGPASRLRCSRGRGHTGRHAVYGLTSTLAVWS